MSAGLNKLGLVPEMVAEGKAWSFFGIQSKNCKETALSTMAAMSTNMTCVALYETLGEDALKYICDQTKLRTILIEKGLVETICNRKTQDTTRMKDL